MCALLIQHELLGDGRDSLSILCLPWKYSGHSCSWQHLWHFVCRDNGSSPSSRCLPAQRKFRRAPNTGIASSINPASSWNVFSVARRSLTLLACRFFYWIAQQRSYYKMFHTFFSSVLFAQWTAMTKLLNNFLHMLDVVHHHSRALYLLLLPWCCLLVVALAASKCYPYVILHYQQGGRAKAHTETHQPNQHIALNLGKIILLYQRFSQ